MPFTIFLLFWLQFLHFYNRQMNMDEVMSIHEGHKARFLDKKYFISQ